MTGQGRPLRFLLLVIGGWTGARIWWLRDGVPPPPTTVRAVAPLDRIAGLPLMRPDVPSLHSLEAVSEPRAGTVAVRRVLAGGAVSSAVQAAPPRRMADPRLVALAQTSILRFGDPVPEPDPAGAVPPGRSGSRLSGSAWLLARGGPGVAGGLAGAQLGGSQAGVRLAYAIDSARRLAITGRLSTALASPAGSRLLSDREAAVGLAWRPTRLPVTLVAEQRFVLDGGRGGPVLGAIAGLPPTRIAGGFRLEAYGQAGVIARSGGAVEGFGDGAARAARPVTLAGMHLDVGAGIWGGAQRGASRLDIGPSLAATVPVVGRPIRVALDWRERVAGTARPGSGPALSIGTDF